MAEPVIAICPVLLAGAQMSRSWQARSPAGHHAEPGQLAASRDGADEQGAANQVRLLGESAATLGGHTCSEQGGDPNDPAPLPPPPAAQVPDENPAWLTNSRVASRASRVPPLRQIPPPPRNPDPLK